MIPASPLQERISERISCIIRRFFFCSSVARTNCGNRDWYFQERIQQRTGCRLRLSRTAGVEEIVEEIL